MCVCVCEILTPFSFFSRFSTWQVEFHRLYFLSGSWHAGSLQSGLSVFVTWCRREMFSISIIYCSYFSRHLYSTCGFRDLKCCRGIEPKCKPPSICIVLYTKLACFVREPSELCPTRICPGQHHAPFDRGAVGHSIDQY